MQFSRAEFEQGIETWLNRHVSDNAASTESQRSSVSPCRWLLKREPFTGHAWLEQLGKVIASNGSKSNGQSTDSDDVLDGCTLSLVHGEEVDQGATPPAAGPRSLLLVDFYVAFSPVYRVPVLYFRARDQDGGLVALERLIRSQLFHPSTTEYPLNRLNEPGGDAESEETDPSHFPTISQAEHPQTGTPCFYLHPCETSAVLAEILAEASAQSAQSRAVAPERAIETWFMLVCTLVDLRG